MNRSIPNSIDIFEVCSIKERSFLLLARVKEGGKNKIFNILIITVEISSILPLPAEKMPICQKGRK